MEQSLELNIALLRGYLLNPQTPPEITQAINSVIGQVSDIYFEKRSEIRTVAVTGFITNPGFEPVKRPHRCKLIPEKHLDEVQRLHDGVPGEIEPMSNVCIGKRYDVSDQTVVNFLKRYGRYDPQAPIGRPKNQVLDTQPPACAISDLFATPTKMTITPKGDAPTRKAGDDSPKAAAVAIRAMQTTSHPPRPFIPPPSPRDPFEGVAREDIHGIKFKPVKKESAMDRPAPQYKPGARRRKPSAGSADHSPIPAGALVEIHEMLSRKMPLDLIAEELNCSQDELEAFIIKNKNAQITVCGAAHANGVGSTNHIVKPSSRPGRGTQ